MFFSIKISITPVTNNRMMHEEERPPKPTDLFCNCCSPQMFKVLFLLIRSFILRKNSDLVEGIEKRLIFTCVKGTNSVQNSYQGSLLVEV